MRKWRTIFFASAAALALTTGASLAQGGQEHGSATGAAGATVGSRASGAASGAQMHGRVSAQERGGVNAQGHGGLAAQERGGMSAQGRAGVSTQERGAAGAQGRGGLASQERDRVGAQRNAPGFNRNAGENRGAIGRNAQNRFDEQDSQQYPRGGRNYNRAEQQNRELNRGTAQEQQRLSERNAATGRSSYNNRAAQRLERNERLQGNASGTSARLNDQQRNEIRTTMIDRRGAPRVGHVDFDVAVGTVVPRGHIHILPVPETLVRIEPQWRGYEYFVYEDEVVVVDPVNMTIVAVLPA